MWGGWGERERERGEREREREREGEREGEEGEDGPGHRPFVDFESLLLYIYSTNSLYIYDHFSSEDVYGFLLYIV